MSRSRILTLVILITIPFLVRATRQERNPPVSVFKDLDGTWKGNFVGYDVTGKEIYRIEATHTYRTVDDNNQDVTIEDRMPDGTVIRGRGKNIARVNKNGVIEISCDVKKSNGDRILHRGRLIKGPGGRNEFAWYTITDDKSETFRESVVHEGDDTFYLINGMGRYGDRLILMAGRYQKVGD